MIPRNVLAATCIITKLNNMLRDSPGGTLSGRDAYEAVIGILPEDVTFTEIVDVMAASGLICTRYGNLFLPK